MYYQIIMIFLVRIMTIYAENNKGSLTFVIDHTGSMAPDIKQVKRSTKAIANTIFNTNASQVHNMVLVTFDDPNAEYLIETTDINEFNKKLDDITLIRNADCPEMSLTGTLLALEKSRHDSYVYVFTDDSPKETVKLKNYAILNNILRIAQNNGHQIVFIVSPNPSCYVPTFRTDIQPYYDIAAATSGQVFMVNDKNEIISVLDYIKETVSGSRTIITSRIIPANTLETIPFTIDPKTEYAIISTSGMNVELNFITPTDYDTVTLLNNIKALKITKPGDYIVQVKGGGVTSILVFGRTDFMFNYGFSEFMPEHFNETSKIPPTDGKLYISIEVLGNASDVNINMVELTDTTTKFVQLYKLEPSGGANKFYLTEKFQPKRGTLILSIIGITTSGKIIRRTSRTPIDMSRKVTGSKKSPTVFINQGAELGLDYNISIKLRCTITAYPKPDVIWENFNTGYVTVAEVFTQEAPYQFISDFKIDHLIQNYTFICKAKNDQGKNDASIKLFVKNIPHIKNIELPKDAILLLRNRRKFVCKVDSFPIARVIWKKNNVILHDTEFIKISTDGDSLIITNMQPELEGNYSCEVNNDYETKIYQFNVIFGFVTIKNLTLSKTEVLVEDTIVIFCEAIGVPTPTITWHLNNKTIENVGRFKILSNSLRFQVTVRDSGLYVCKASNGITSTTKTVELTVFEIPIMNNSSSHEKTILQNFTIDVSCPIIGGNPTPQVTWVFNNVTINNTNNVIIFDSVQKSNSGLYECTASNKYGNATYKILLIVNYPPTFNSKTKPLLIKIGETATLPCKVDSSPAAIVNWYTKELNLITNTDKYHIDEENTLSFTVTSPRENIFFCKASNKFGTNYQDTKLNIFGMESPKIFNTESLIRLPQGLSVNIPCGAISGRPTPTISWLFNNMTTSFTDTVLFVPSLQRSDAGIYICIATNEYGNATHTLQLIVDYLPEFKSVTKPLRIIIGETVTIPCKVDSSTAVEIKWFKNESKILTDALKYHIDEQNTLSFTVTSAEDGGNYKCEAINKIGNASQITNAYAKPHIQKTVNFTRELKGLDVNISCGKISGHPPPTIVWLFNNRTTHYTDAEIILHSVQLNNAGLYKCIATNAHGNDSHEIDFTVNYPPEFKSETRFISKKVGETVIIPCEFDSSPAASVEWLYKDIKLIHNAEKYIDRFHTLRFVTRSSNETGNYTCEATNTFGKNNQTTFVDVLEKPIISKLKPINALEGDKITVPCRIIGGNPHPTMTWIINDVRTSYSDEVISFSTTGVQRSDKGLYECIAKNDNGIDSHQILLTVEYAPEITMEVKPTSILKEGEKVTIRCIVDGVPQPTVKWFHNIDEITNISDYSIINDIYSSSQSKIHTLSFKANISDNGKYTCKATNVHDEKEENHIITIYSPIDFSPLHHVNTKLNIIEGDNTELVCNPDGYPKPSVKWKFYSKMELDYTEYFHAITNSNGTIFLNKLSIKDSGYYVCIASNLYDSKNFSYEVQVEAKTKKIEDKTPPEIVSGDLYLVIPCVTRNPKSKIRWLRNSDDIIIDGFKFSLDPKGSLVIRNVTSATNGMYICFAKNEHDDKWVESKINTIRVKPYPMKYPKTPKYSKHNISDGDSLNVTCPVLDSKTISSHDYLRWYKDKKHYVDGDLRFINSSYLNRGTYICRISYHNSTDSENAYVTIKMGEGKPVFLNYNEEKPIKGTNIKLDCRFDGIPVPTIKWTHNGMQIMVSKPIHFFKFHPSLRGMYQCTVQNKFGNITRNFVV